MGIAIVAALGALILAIVAFRRPPDRATPVHHKSKWLLRAGLFLLGLYVVFFLFFGVGEIVTGELSGIAHLLPAVLIMMLMMLAWRRPREAGVVLIAIGPLTAIAAQGGGPFHPGAVMAGIPFTVAGLLLLGAAERARRA